MGGLIGAVTFFAWVLHPPLKISKGAPVIPGLSGYDGTPNVSRVRRSALCVVCVSGSFFSVGPPCFSG